MTDTELDAIMRIMDSAFDPQWGEAWTRNQVSSALMLSNTHATLIAASGEDLRDPAEAEGFAIVRAAPGEEEILADLLPRGVATQIFSALLENGASEQGARISAMDNATRNAGDMIDKLTIQFNRSRQAVITNELIEIISGAEAL